MTKPVTSRRLVFEVEMYWRGKRRVPSVNIAYGSDTYPGLPMCIDATAFSDAAKELCTQLVAAGELDHKDNEGSECV